MFRNLNLIGAFAAFAFLLAVISPASAQMSPGEIEPNRLSGMMAHVLFKTVCVDNFGNSKAVRSWANHYMKKMDDIDPNVKTNDLAEVWAQSASVGGFILRLSDDPWNCMVSAQNADINEVHQQMKGLADEIDSQGEYKTKLLENTHPESGTRYSMLHMISDSKPNLVIIVSTNNNRANRVSFSISTEESSGKQ